MTVTQIRRQMLDASPTLSQRAHCSVCGREVEIVSKREAASILNIEEQNLEAFINTAPIHLIETVSGSLWVCKDSLFVCDNS